MAPELKHAGEILVALRKERGLTQERLAQLASVDTRTVQRLEAGVSVRADSITALAGVLGVNPTTLYGPRSVTELVGLAEEVTCRFCGALIAHQANVDYENVDIDCVAYACGAEDGVTFRPCPRDPRFPSFSDYELEFYEDGDDIYCYARGKTEMARAVYLDQGFGRTKESAAKWVERSYIQARDGYDAAEAFNPFSEHV
jgi:transcriptional regulator with XRE-family HTH domain